MRNFLKNSIVIFSLMAFFVWSTPVYANTHSIDLELGSSQFLSIADASQTGLDIAGDMTIEAWMQLESAQGGSFRGIVSKHDNGSQIAYILALTGTDGVVFFGTSSDGSTQDSDTIDTGSFNTEQWYHIAVTYDASAGTARLYIDGTDVGGFSGLATSLHNSSESFKIGARGPGGGADFWDGELDEVRMWDDIRTASEIDTNKCVELVGNEANLQGYWELDNDLLDQTANNNDLTNNNSATFNTDNAFTSSLCAEEAVTPPQFLILE